ncbi:Aldose reductase [Spraguea lophii 42_110]|uniref:Aldose reductase n=1 Tax=Spraguea lophii (strain 42_110) TaxID=1358809 RepID=S7W7H1_SPRLO|nr:Aldose reductase [Spraguea lophii 42_110]
MINKNVLRLYNNNTIPIVGLGAWKTTDLNDVENVFNTALELGYRHIDTAYNYKNEKFIGIVLDEAFKTGIVKREELFITSKLWSGCHNDPEKYLDESLENLKLDYLDLYLIHWPVTIKVENGVELTDNDGNYITEEFHPIKIWKIMESFVKKGKVKNIGVSNFGFDNLNLILKNCEIQPAVNQIEVHPYYQEKELIEFCTNHNIKIIAYSPLGSYAEETGFKPLREDPIICDIAKKHNTSQSKVLLNFLTQQNIAVIPKSSSRKHLQDNIEILKLDEDDMERIKNIHITHKYRDPVFMGPNRYK